MRQDAAYIIKADESGRQCSPSWPSMERLF